MPTPFTSAPLGSNCTCTFSTRSITGEVLRHTTPTCPTHGIASDSMQERIRRAAQGPVRLGGGPAFPTPMSPSYPQHYQPEPLVRSRYPLEPSWVTTPGESLKVNVSLASTEGTVMTLEIQVLEILGDRNLDMRANFTLRLKVEKHGETEWSYRTLYDFPWTNKNVAGLVYRALGEFVDVMGALE